jgi:hypothetical protein
VIKTHDATLKPGTHFEQVPLEQVPLEEVVRKVADNVTFEPPSKKTEPYSMPTGLLRLVTPAGSSNEDRSKR